MGRRIYIDLGANNGLTIRQFLQENPDFIVFAFEPTPKLAEKLRIEFRGVGSGVHLMEYAAWIFDGILDFYLGEHSDQSSTVLTGKKSTPEWTVNYSAPTKVQAIDFDRWLRENTSDDDDIVIKMDIEGSEYKLLQRLIDTGALRRVRDLRVEWHWDRYPGEVSRAEHDRIRNRLMAITKLTDWH